MSIDPRKVQREAFWKKPPLEQVNILLKVYATGTLPPELPGLSDSEVQALLMRILITSSLRLEGLTKWLCGLTVVLAVLTAALVYDVAQRLIGN